MNMTTRRLLTIILGGVLSAHSLAQSQVMDIELSELATRLATLTKENGRKKVTVLDFTDLQGGASELGKYIAEDLTVNLVMIKQGFSVLDRANLRKILTEHKLTATGLVDPENAKKLGQFAGVDALILGTIIPKNQKITLTAKIIATDSAEIVGATKSEFNSDEMVQQLLAQSASTEVPGEPNSSRRNSPATPTKPFGDLQVRVETIRLLPGDNIYGYAQLTLTITNTSPSKTYGVAVNPDFYHNFNLTNSRGDEFKATEVNGIETAFDADGRYFRGSVTDIPPKTIITVTSKSQVNWTGKPGDYRPYRFQTVFIFGEEENGKHPNLKKLNCSLEVK